MEGTRQHWRCRGNQIRFGVLKICEILGVAFMGGLRVVMSSPEAGYSNYALSFPVGRVLGGDRGCCLERCLVGFSWEDRVLRLGFSGRRGNAAAHSNVDILEWEENGGICEVVALDWWCLFGGRLKSVCF